MTEHSTHTKPIDELRKHAKAKRRNETISVPDMSPEKVDQLLCELQAHQIELEMQNEELRRVQEELRESRDCYSDLYDFAPVGYVTISSEGSITNSNLTLAGMLGVERRTLIKQPFSRYILPDDQSIFYRYRKEILNMKPSRTCRMRMLRKDADPFWVQMDSILKVTDDQNDVLFRTVIIDIDTGCGMDAETIDRIFEPFFTTKFTGRGLGLSAVLGIVRGHKAALEIKSEVGKGTRVRVLFRTNESSDDGVVFQKNSMDVEDEWQGKGTVLFVDDEEIVRKTSKQILEYMGFSVLLASDGREALRTFSEHKEEIVCVILDLTMPGMDGTEVFGELRRLDSDVRVILCSGYNEQQVIQSFAGKAIPAAFIQKPFNVATLTNILKKIASDDCC